MPFQSPIPENRKRKDEAAQGLKLVAEAEKMMHFAFVMPSCVFIGWLIGAWLESRLHQHWLLIAGILLGCVSGLVYVIQQAIETEKRSCRIEAKQAAQAKLEEQTKPSPGDKD
ncbi:AtpZ/AtpI family protein [Telmatobacter bradus]|uniref:AtpZ/AtpI family protein n=1 Tax=Telmatobacter bradus TaxID=474953 RepID=UPI003B427FFE